MSYCLCCNSSLLRHVRHGEIYLYCPECRQEMPEASNDTTEESPSILSALIFRAPALVKL